MAWSRSGRGETPTAVIPAGVGRERLGCGLWGVRACARGRNRWQSSWRSCWCARVAWKGSEEGEFDGRKELVGVGVPGERKFSMAARGFILATQCLLRMRTPGRRPARKQLLGRARGGAGRSSSAPAAVHPPCSSTVAGHIPLFCCFAKFVQTLN